MALRKSIRTPLLVGVTLVIGVLSILLIFRRKPPPLARLVNGTEVMAVSAAYGTNHFIVTRTPLLGPLNDFLPAPMDRLFSRLHSAPSGIDSGEPTLAVTIQLLGPSAARSYSGGITAQIVDEHGCIFPRHTTWKGVESCQFGFARFPRRMQLLELDVSFSGIVTQVVHFRVPNPIAGKKIQDWAAESLPSTKRVDDLSFTLQRVKFYTNTLGERYLSLLPSIQLTHDGTPATEWSPPEIATYDATGNSGPFYCLNEKVYRIRATAWPNEEHSFAESNLWRLRGMQLPNPGSIARFSTNARIGGLSLSVAGCAAPGVYTFSNCVLTIAMPASTNAVAAWGTSGDGRVETTEVTWPKYHILFAPFSFPYGRRLLLRVTDEGGRVASTLVSQGRELCGWQCCELNVPEGAKQMNLEVILAEPRVADFFVAAPRPAY